MDDTLFEGIYLFVSQSEELEAGETEKNVSFSCFPKSGFTHQPKSFLCPKTLKHCNTSHFREFRNALLRALWSLFVIGDATVFDALLVNVS